MRKWVKFNSGLGETSKLNFLFSGHEFHYKILLKHSKQTRLHKPKMTAQISINIFISITIIITIITIVIINTSIISTIIIINIISIIVIPRI